MPTVRIEYYGLEGAGKNVTEAKRDAGRKIEAALSGTYDPEILTHRGHAEIVVRSPAGWHHFPLTGEAGEIREGHRYLGSGDGSRDDALRSARLNLAQQTWRVEDGLTPPPFLADRAEQSEFRRWAQFQLDHKKARAAGLNDHEAHHYACGCLGRPDLSERVNAFYAAAAQAG